jgi:hypothetical protein
MWDLTRTTKLSIPLPWRCSYAAVAGTARAHSRSNIEDERCSQVSRLMTLTGSQSSES